MVGFDKTKLGLHKIHEAVDLKVIEEKKKILSSKKKAFIHSSVCLEYGLENLEIALNHDFKHIKGLDSCREKFIKLNKIYSELSSELNKFIKIQDLSDDYYNLKDTFEEVIDQLVKGNVMFATSEEIEKIKDVKRG